MIQLTEEQHPHVRALLTELYGANGYPAKDCTFQVPGRFAEQLVHIEVAAGQLTPEEIQTFVDGEEQDARAIALRNPSLTAAHQMLEAVFNDERDDLEHSIGRTTPTNGEETNG